MIEARFRRKLMLAWALCWCAHAYAYAEPVLQVSRFEGASSSVSIPALVAGEMDKRFVALRGTELSPKPTVSGWYRIESSEDWPSDRRPMLVLRTWSSSRLVLWRQGQEHPRERESQGPKADLSYSAGLLALPLEGGLRAGEPIYLHVEVPDFAGHALSIEPEQSLRSEDQQRVRSQSLVHGTLLALALAGLGMGLALRESNFLLLAGALGFSLLYLLAASGEYYRWPLLSSIASFMPYPLVIGGNGIGLMVSLFVRRFLDMPRNTPRLSRLQWPVLLLFLAGMTVSFLPGQGGSKLWAYIGNFNIVACSLILLCACVISLRSGNNSPRLLLWSLSPLMGLAFWRVGEVLTGSALNPIMSMLFTLSFLFLGLMLFVGLFDRVLQYKRERDAADTLARHDPLTEAYNRRALDERLQGAMQESRLRGRPLALLFADLDHFKRVNDEHGHDAGDECLREVARRIHSSLRIGDFFGRYGGEEFVVGLPGMTSEEAAAVGERIRHRVAAEPVACGNSALSLTISIGVSVLQRGGESVDEALKRADKALYVSKDNGRDRVSVL